MEEEQEESLAQQRQRRRTVAAAEPPAAAAPEGGTVGTTGTEAPPCEAVPLAEADEVEAFRRRTQLPAMPGHFSLFKAAPVQSPAVAGRPPQLLPRVPAANEPQQGATLSASSDASACSLPQLGYGAGAGGLRLPGSIAGTASSQAALSAPLAAVIRSIEAGKLPWGVLFAVNGGWAWLGLVQHSMACKAEAGTRP